MFFEYLSDCLSLECLGLYLPKINPSNIFSALAMMVPLLLMLKKFLMDIEFPQYGGGLVNEDISACRDFFAAWSKHVSARKIVDFLGRMDLYPCYYTYDIHLKQMCLCRIAEGVQDHLKLWLYNPDACPTGIWFTMKDVQV